MASSALLLRAFRSKKTRSATCYQIIITCCAAGPARFIDVNAIDDRPNATRSSERSAAFGHWQGVVDRDGSCIVLHADPIDCTACHILLHPKGDEYMKYLSGQRAEEGEAPVVDTGDMRNGLLLYDGLRRAFRAGDIALLLVTLALSSIFVNSNNEQTPNPYLLPADVPATSLPVPPSRLALQHVVPQSRVNSLAGPHNSDAWLCTSDTRSSAYLLHFLYAHAILRRWGHPNSDHDATHPLAAANIQAIFCDTFPLALEEAEQSVEASRDGREAFASVMDQVLFLNARTAAQLELKLIKVKY
ncbi:hypothetical protein B0H10DRAFT_1947907 [Mycena sp. CBHHK59/15]|nr:hypothetical protein B0H10DRAFT_1947907 [Mycena sp. CBHHK59/15]